MSELANYSIETDHSVWLAFKDGVNFRVPVAQLHKHLAPRDLQKVRRAIRLRREFFRQHMPKTLVIFVVLGLAMLVAAGGGALAYVWHETHPVAPAPPHTDIVHSTNTATPEPSTAPPTVVSSAAPVAGGRTGSRARPIPRLVRAPILLSTPAALVTPIPGTDSQTVPVATTPPVPSPSPSPSPDVPPAGQVLGDSTGPPATPVPPLAP